MTGADEFELPELPELTTVKQWKGDTQKTGVIRSMTGDTRSKKLTGLDGALEEYGIHYGTYTKLREQYNENRSNALLEQLAQAYGKAAEAYGDAGTAFTQVEKTFTEWGTDHGRNPDAIKKLQADIQRGSEVIQEGQQKILDVQNRFRLVSEEHDVPKVRHEVWIGGVPGEDVIKSAKIWIASHPDHTVNIWIDRNNLLANDFKSETENLRKEARLNAADDPTITRRIDTWKGVADQDRRRGLDEHLRAIGATLGKNSADELHGQRQSQLDDLQKRLASDNKIVVRDVEELFDPQKARNPFPDNEGALSAESREEVRQIYQFQAGERCNFAAASDHIRNLVNHDEPGWYGDADMTPPIKGLDKLINAWNEVADPQSQIDPKIGLLMLNKQGYQDLIAAVEEQATLILNSGRGGGKDKGELEQPAYDQLVKVANAIEKVDGTGKGKVQAAFDEWKNGLKTLADVYDQVPEIKVGPQAFKMLQTSGAGVASSNAVIVSSTRGAPALAEYARGQAKLCREEMTPEKRRNFMDDRPENRGPYKMLTLKTSGPAVMKGLMIDPNGKKAFEKYGIPPDAGSTLFMIPYTSFPHPSTAEANHSWLPRAPTQTGPALPQQREGRSASSIPSAGASTELPQRRVDSPGHPSMEVPGESSHGRGRGRR